ncbi:transcriptional regulator domain-containing protein [Sphingosinicella rhizophila]|uniref:DUF6499 domain-containing protein n=1 Tax=Sphingosinicella rhizophila TaxID=3050082 RepID=A0ABU3Q5C2_9SPHN|nr:DUF6499 domain-containing protein [Sphingosinicella sp. GR2756]MDT9598611.1 DUF6499 domain-containing protein [Sphingosinicella sp. GR2756]
MPVWVPPDWRDAGAYAPVLAGGRPALAWELLRRDPDYGAFARRGGATTAGAARWGLHFPG